MDTIQEKMLKINIKHCLVLSIQSIKQFSLVIMLKSRGYLFNCWKVDGYKRNSRRVSKRVGKI